MGSSVSIGDAVLVGFIVWLGVGVAVFAGRSVSVGDAVADAVSVGVRLGRGVLDGRSVFVGDGVLDALMVGVADNVSLAVAEAKAAISSGTAGLSPSFSASNSV